MILLPDMSRATYGEYMESPAGREAETRVFYVGVTRTQETLVLVRPRSRRHFLFPSVRERGNA